MKCRLPIFDTARCILHTKVFFFFFDGVVLVSFLVFAFVSPINCRQSQQKKRQ
jgi:hypothetical protein